MLVVTMQRQGSSHETSFFYLYWPYSRVFALIRGLVLALERGREADLRAERLASGAGNSGSSEFLGAVWSAATKLKPMANPGNLIALSAPSSTQSPAGSSDAPASCPSSTQSNRTLSGCAHASGSCGFRIQTQSSPAAIARAPLCAWPRNLETPSVSCAP